MSSPNRSAGFGRVLGLVLLVQLLVPPAFWHAFVEHDDSHHCEAEPGGYAAVDVKHIHCPALELNLPLAERLDDFFLQVQSALTVLVPVKPVLSVRYRYDAGLFSRGPPRQFS